MRKVQRQLLVSVPTRDRVNALAIVRHEPGAEVYRVLIDRALPGLEKAHAEALRELGEIAARLKMTVADLAEQATRDGYDLEALRGMKRYPRG